ncbi:MAG TPA: pyridoxamine 5'-phosphate oxidase, partial [Methylotenera mobilis]|nr:pyridoxamine 5'-phosphate oxidase [Methylotenera mobilis]
NATVGEKTTTLRFNFETKIHDAQSARAALVSLSKSATL